MHYVYVFLKLLKHIVLFHFLVIANNYTKHAFGSSLHRQGILATPTHQIKKPNDKKANTLSRHAAQL
jgi:hypothetical protein